MLFSLLGRLLGRRPAPALAAPTLPRELPEDEFFHLLRYGLPTVEHLVAHARWLMSRDTLGAAALLLEATRRENDSALAYQVLGELHLRLGNLQSAAECFHLALVRDERSPASWQGLARVRHAQGRHGEARYAAAQATRLEKGSHVECANFSAGLSPTAEWAHWRRFLADVEEAAEPLAVENWLDSQAAAAAPTCNVRLALSLWLTRHARPRAGRQFAEEAYGSDPGNPVATYALALAHSALNQTSPATSLCRSGLTRAPEDPDLWSLLADCLAAAGDLSGALTCYESALLRQPQDVYLLNNYGCTLTLLERFGEAVAPLRQSLALRPDLQKTRLNLAYALTYLGEHREARAHLENVLAAEPYHFDAHWYRAQLLLAAHEYAAGWDDYRYRFVSAAQGMRLMALPRWQGEPLRGKTLLIIGEQGIGDEIMFASCLPDLLSQDIAVKVACSPRLESLFRRSFPAASIVSEPLPPGEQAAIADVYLPLGDLPALLRRDKADFCLARPPYLQADPALCAAFSARLAALGPGCKVGIAWRGGTTSTRQQTRSLPLTSLRPILEVAGCHFVSLQHDASAEEIAASGFDLRHWPDAFADLDAFAALVFSLDLIITVCSAPAHFAGGLGRPAWVLAPHAPEWRYYALEGHMPWYPTVKLYHQSANGNWEALIRDVSASLDVWRKQTILDKN